jgi:DNA recombination protein RmuC
MLTTIRAVLRDVRMREQAGLIQVEVQTLLKDVMRLDDRVGKLQSHFNQASDDVRQIRISTEKIARRGTQIAEVEIEEIEEIEAEAEVEAIGPQLKAVSDD